MTRARRRRRRRRLRRGRSSSSRARSRAPAVLLLSRSGSWPVSARTSVDLPWSTCPAVATTCTSALVESRGPAHGVDQVVVGARGTVIRSSSSRPSATWPTTGGSPSAERVGQGRGRETAALGSTTPGAPPPPTARLARARPRREVRAERVGDPARAGAAGRPGVPPGLERPGGVGPGQGGLEGGQGELVDPQRARQREAAHAAPPATRHRAAARTGGRRGACRRRRSPARLPTAGSRRASGSSGSRGCGRQQTRADVGHDRDAEPASSPTGTEEVNPRPGSSTDGPSARTPSRGRRPLRSRRGVPGWWSRPHAVARRPTPAAPGSGTRRRSRPSPRARRRPRGRPRAQQPTRASAAAPLLTTCTAPASGTAAASAASAPRPRGPRRPVAGRARRRWAGGGHHAPRRLPRDRGARPRLVCTTTPVALMTARSDVAEDGQRCEDHGRRPRPARRRRRGTRRRTSVTMRLTRRPAQATQRRPRSRGSARTTSVRGVRRGHRVGMGHLPLRRGSVAMWRRRTGIEPA